MESDHAGKTYWDAVAGKPFQLPAEDIEFSHRIGAPAPYTHYMRRVQENFSWLHYEGQLRTTKCGKTGKGIQTNWPAEYDGRILSETAYLEIIN